jgi:hypothetical protein
MASATITSEQFSSKSTLGSISTLHYPMDLGNGRHGNYINFFIHTPQKSSYKLNSDNSTMTMPDGTPSTTSVFNTDNATQSIANQNATAFVTNSINIIGNAFTPKPIGYIPTHGKEITATNVLGNINGGNEFAPALTEAATAVLKFLVTGATTNLTDVVSLYMPDTINMNQSSEYEGASLTDALGKYGLLASGVTSVIDNISELSDGKGVNYDSLRSLASNPAAMEASTGYLSGLTSKNIGTSTDSTALQKIALNKIGYALNPQIQILFKTIDFRTFQYDFTFSPSSQQEADMVTKIIKTFKYHAAPDLSSETLGRYFIPPSTFDIEYMMAGGVPNPNLHRISTCVLTTVSVDYAPRGFVTYDNGSPVQTRMTLQFQETELMTKQRISENF